MGIYKYALYQTDIRKSSEIAGMGAKAQWVMIISDVLDRQNPGVVQGAETVVDVGTKGKMNL